MKNVLQYSSEIYARHLPLILLFSISFIIAFLIPAFASFPTYNDVGGIFLRLASVLTNLTPFTTAVITFSMLLSLLFLSFAIVAINVIVKHSRTQTRIRKEVMDGLEKYTSRVFVVLLLYTIIVVFFDMLAYTLNASEVYAAILSIVFLPFFFYAPASIVVDEKGLKRAMQQSLSFFFKRLDYIALWFVVAIVLLSVFDLIFIAVGGTMLSRYLILVFNSLFILPFLVVLQAQSYMGRFPMLKR
jgi:hypothetical protein